MGVADLFDEPSGTREAIMHATYHALCTHGYANLTIQRIGEEFPKSPSLIYHHYDGKDALLLDFLTFMLERFEATVPEREYDDPAVHLHAIIEHVLPDTYEPERENFARAMIELRAQAAHDPAYREHFTRTTAFFRDRLAHIITTGVEAGVFRSVDPDRTAALVLATIDGARLQRVTTTDDPGIGVVRAELHAYVRRTLLAPDHPDADAAAGADG